MRFNFAASNTLAQQIQAGAPADIFFSADEAKMDELDAAGLIAKDTRKNLLGNSLVIITPLDGLKHLHGRKISTQPGHQTPVARRSQGRACRSLCQGLVRESRPVGHPRTEDRPGGKRPHRPGGRGVRKRRGRHRLQDRRSHLEEGDSRHWKSPPRKARRIIYPAAVVKDSRNAEAARKFLAYLADKRTGAIFAKFGFSVID